MKARVLPPEEWGRLVDQDLPVLLPYAHNGDVSVVVVEDGSRIVASMAIMRVTHLEGVWIDPEYRNAGTVRRLLGATIDAAKKWPSNWAIAGAADDRMRDILPRMGATKVPVDSYVLTLGGS